MHFVYSIKFLELRREGHQERFVQSPSNFQCITVVHVSSSLSTNHRFEYLADGGLLMHPILVLEHTRPKQASTTF